MRKQPDSEKKSVEKKKTKPHLRALRWLTRREYSEFEIRHRLGEEGYSSEEIAQAIAWLVSNNWQSNARFASSLARRRSATYGSRLIKAELQQHQVAAPEIQQAFEDLEVSDEQRALSWLNKRTRHQTFSPENQAKWFRALLARGFSPDDVKKALKQCELLRSDTES
ncbi:MAG: recombination regulator RecX [Burkholderiales bacterium]|nr:recombination regulator RecX [Burkholderiales bacterium]